MIVIDGGKVNDPSQLNRFIEFFEDFEQRPFFHVQRPLGAKLPTAEAADAAVVVEMKPFSGDLNRPRRTGVAADPAVEAFLRDLARPRREVVAEAVFQEIREPELDV